MKKLRIALVHDDLVQWGGAERVLGVLARLFPEADIYTSIVDMKNKNILAHLNIERVRVSFMQKIPFWQKFYRAMVFLYPLAFESFNLSDYDLVISQTTRFAKSVITRPDTMHICYCHTPPRFLWRFSDQKAISRWLLPFISIGRIVDQVIAKRVDYWFAGSKNCQDRLQKIYQVSSRVIYPFASETFFTIRDVTDEGFFLVIARLIDYKKVNIAVEACIKLDMKLVIVGSGPEKKNLMHLANDLVSFVDGVTDEELAQLISKCRAVIVTAEEDFGLVSIETQAVGKPVIAYGVGGSKETVIDGVTGVLYDKQTSEALVEAINRFNMTEFDFAKIRKNAAQYTENYFCKQFIDSLSKFGYSFS